MTDEELNALENNLAVRGKQDREMSNHYVHRMEVDRVAAKSAITTLRAQLAEAQHGRNVAEACNRGLVRLNEATQARADRAEAALAAQIEVDAGICDGMHSSTIYYEAHECANAIRAQPHDRTALDRHDAKTREKALREAYDSLFKHPGFIHAISGQKFKAVKLEDAAEAILALIEVKP